MSSVDRNKGATLSIFIMETYVIGVEGTPNDPKLLYYLVSVRKWPTQALLDSGASANCIDETLVDKVGRAIKKRANGILPYSDKRRANVRRIAEIEVRAKGYREKVSFWVVRGLGIPMLLGKP